MVSEGSIQESTVFCGSILRNSLRAGASGYLRRAGNRTVYTGSGDGGCTRGGGRTGAGAGVVGTGQPDRGIAAGEPFGRRKNRR